MEASLKKLYLISVKERERKFPLIKANVIKEAHYENETFNQDKRPLKAQKISKEEIEDSLRLCL